MPLISLVINTDSRSQNDLADTMFNGTVNLDYLTDGVRNKQLFLKGFDFETIVFIDKHNEIPQITLDYLREVCDVLVIRKHTSETNFNDKNYIEALNMARGKYVMHFDQDTNAFTSSMQPIQDMINGLEVYDYISYPSHWSPLPVHDESFDHVWASTRFFMCKRETLDFTELRWMMEDYDRCYEKYPINRKCFWLEHWLGQLAKYKGKGIIYPPINLETHAIFTWKTYEQWTLRRLNELSYEEIKQFINSKGGIQYPVDVSV